MRKLNKKVRGREIRRQRSRMRRLREPAWRKFVQRQQLAKAKRRRRTSIYEPAICLYAPRVVSIVEPVQRSELMRFISAIRSHFKNHPHRTLVLDFSETAQFFAEGTILVFAEISRMISYRTGTVKLRCREPQNHKASQVLQQIGIYKLCSNSSKVKPVADDVVHWQVVQGKLVDNSLCAPSIEGFQGRIGAEVIDELLGGLSEAMTNAIHHAYDGIRQDGLDFNSSTDWWMFSQAKDEHLSVLFCDLGIGIPASLPVKRKKLWDRMISLNSAPTDSECIQEAIVEGRTRTGMDGRGYGLGDIVSVVENVPRGVVDVYSNHGRYLSINGTTKIVDFVESICGTLICWRVPLNASKIGA